MASSQLIALPVELLCLVASQIDSATDYGSLRATCKHAEASLFSLFARKYFGHFQVMRTDFSLQTLIDISKSRFAPYVKQVIVGTEVPEEQYPLRYPNLSELYKVDEPVVDQQSFMSSGCDRAMLIEAFKRLPLEVAGIRDAPVSMCPMKRKREYSPLRRRSYGYLTIARSRARGECQYWDTSQAVSCLQTLLNALGGANARPKRIVAIVNQFGNLGEHSLEIPTPEKREIMRPMLHQLKDLRLEINAGAWTQNLRLFLGNTDDLQSLRLDFTSGMNDRYKGFVAWLAAARPLGHVPQLPPPPVTLPHLRLLDLTNVTVETAIILGAVRKFSPTLRSLALSDVKLSMHLPFDINLPGHGELPSPWEDFVDGLLEFGDTLDTIYFSYPADDFTGQIWASRRDRVFRINNSEFRSVSYSGSNVRKALEGLSASLTRQDSFWEPDLIGELTLDDESKSPVPPSQEEVDEEVNNIIEDRLTTNAVESEEVVNDETRTDQVGVEN